MLKGCMMIDFIMVLLLVDMGVYLGLFVRFVE